MLQGVSLARRLRALLGRFAQAPDQSIALVCRDWANAEAAYRFLSNQRTSEADILTRPFGATRERIATTREASYQSAFIDIEVIQLNPSHYPHL